MELNLSLAVNFKVNSSLLISTGFDDAASKEDFSMTGPVLSTTTGSLIRVACNLVSVVFDLSSEAVTLIS